MLGLASKLMVNVILLYILQLTELVHPINSITLRLKTLSLSQVSTISNSSNHRLSIFNSNSNFYKLCFRFHIAMPLRLGCPPVSLIPWIWTMQTCTTLIITSQYFFTTIYQQILLQTQHYSFLYEKRLSITQSLYFIYFAVTMTLT